MKALRALARPVGRLRVARTVVPLRAARAVGAPFAWSLLIALACGACKPPELRGGEVYTPPDKHSTPKDAASVDVDDAGPSSPSTR